MSIRASQVRIMKEDDGRVCGVFLEADFTAEHEHGIKGLLTAFNVKDPTGKSKDVNDYHALAVPAGASPFAVDLDVIGDTQYLAVRTRGFLERLEFTDFIGRMEREIRWWSPDGLAAAWGEEVFILAAKSPEGRAVQLQLFKSMHNLDFSIYIGTPEGERQAGLFLLVTSIAHPVAEPELVS